MNARSHEFELCVEERQIEEVVCCIFHSLFLERTLGKFHYKQEGSYSVGSIGMVDVDCDFVNFTYIRLASDELDRRLKKTAAEFREELHREGSCSGQISLEFYHKKRPQWSFFSYDCTEWEIWTIKITTIVLANEHERQLHREKVSELLTEKMFYITQAVSRHEYVPKVPSQSELDFVFDTSFPDIQPYLFRISFLTNMTTSTSVGTTMKKFIRDTLAL